MKTGERHRMAIRVARAARLAGSPIGYYNAYADVVDLEKSGENLDAFYRTFYGADAWDAPTGEAIVEKRGRTG